MTEPAEPRDASLSFLIWIAEVEAVSAQAIRIGVARNTRLLGMTLGHELRQAASLAEERLLARKAFHFTPSSELAPLAKEAIEAARRNRPRSIGAPSGRDSPRA